MSLVKDYQSELRRFISSQHLYTGVRVTACVIIPAWILYNAGLLTSMISIPLGALFVGLTDNPGPVHHRRNGMLVSIMMNFVVVLVSGMSRFSPLLIGLEIMLFGFLCSIISVFGTRAGSIGLTALIIFILSTNTQIVTGNVYFTALYYSAGGLWYMLMSLSLSTLRPYRPLQQLLGECLMNTSAYLSAKGLFYKQGAKEEEIMQGLMEQQIQIHQIQEQLRNILFTTRRFVAESTHKGRILTMMFRDSIDLFERAVATHPDYLLMHSEFGNTGIMEVFQRNINTMSLLLYNTGLAVQEGSVYRDDEKINKAIAECSESFDRLRKERLNASNVESFIKLRHVLYSIQNVAERIRRMMMYTSYEKNLLSEFQADVDFSRFATHDKVNFSLLLSNLSLKSSAFRHAVRLTIALVLGYLAARFFSLGHGYWILLTIATIMKPAYSLSKRRNIERLTGTFAGVIVAFAVLYTSPGDTFIFISMILMMIMAYSFLKVNYGLSIAGITIYLLFSFHFLYPTGLNELLADRITDTLIGCAIAYIVSYFILPAWEYQQIDRLAEKSFSALKKYFNTVAPALSGEPPSATAYKVARKEAFVSLANLSDTFQRMLSDPKVYQKNLPLYQQFVAASHLLAIHISALSDYAQKYAAVYQHKDFHSLIVMVNRLFDAAPGSSGTAAGDLQSTPVYKRVQKLLEQRKMDLQSSGIEGTPEASRIMLSELLRITDRFGLIYSTVGQLWKIMGEIGEKER